MFCHHGIHSFLFIYLLAASAKLKAATTTAAASATPAKVSTATSSATTSKVTTPATAKATTAAATSAAATTAKVSTPATAASKPKEPETSQPRPTTRLSKILSHSSSDPSIKPANPEKMVGPGKPEPEIKSKANAAKPVQPVPASKEEAREPLNKAEVKTKITEQHAPQKVDRTLYGTNDSSSEESSEEAEVSNLNKVSTRNLSSTLASLASRSNVSAAAATHKYVDDDDVSDDDDASTKPDDVLQTIKFGSDVMQTMRAKRNEILMHHETSNPEKSGPPVRKDYSTMRQEKTITPSRKVTQEKDERSAAKETEMLKQEFNSRLEKIHDDVTELIETHKSSIEDRVKEIIRQETGELRKEFRQDRCEQVGEGLKSFTNIYLLGSGKTNKD